MNTSFYHVLAVDDHPIVLEGICMLTNRLKNVVCEGLSNIEQLKTEKAKKVYDLYILDLEFPDTDGFTLIHTLRNQQPHYHILIYTMHEESWVLTKLVNLNIQGVVSKHADASELLKAIETIRQGETFFNAAFLAIVAQKPQEIPSSEGNCFKLSAREREILSYLTQGFSSLEICLSLNTIQTYRKRLMTKLKARNVAELVIKGKDLL